PRRSRHGVGSGACGREAAIDQPLPSATLIGAALLLDGHDATVTGLSRRPEIVVARLLGALDADIGGNGMVAVRQVLLDHRRTACEESAGGKSRNDEPGTHHCLPRSYGENRPWVPAAAPGVNPEQGGAGRPAAPRRARAARRSRARGPRATKPARHRS